MDPGHKAQESEGGDRQGAEAPYFTVLSTVSRVTA